MRRLVKHPRGRVLISGIEGFIGTHLGQRLVRMGYHVVGLTRGSHQAQRPDSRRQKFFPFSEYVSAKRSPSQDAVDYVVHLAAITEHARIHGDPIQTLTAELSLLTAMTEYYVRSNARNFVYPSSGKVYGIPSYLPIDERHPLNPTTFLGRFKKISEEVLRYVALASGKPTTVLRIFNVYGPRQKDSFLIPKLLRHAAKSEAIRIGNYGDRRDYLFIDDLVEAFAVVLGSDLKGFNVFNVGSGRSYSPLDLASMIQRITACRLRIAPDPEGRRKSEAENEVASAEAITGLGWTPRTDMAGGLRLTVRALARR